MTIKDGFLLRPLGNAHVVVPVGQAALDLRGMITVNGTGAFLWKALQTPQTEATLTQALLEAYEVDEQTAAADVQRFIDILKQHDLLKQETEEA